MRTRVFETATNTYTASASIGDGACGTVYRVTDSEGDVFALKLLRDANSVKRKRFRNELSFCRKNRHDRIVRVLDEGILLKGQERLPFYVMPLYESTLRKVMEAGPSHGSILPLFRDILDGVEAAHLQKVIHRDLKPENLLVEMPKQRVVVADFGVAHFEEDDLLTAVKTRAADRLANYRYSAPEQRTSGVSVGQQADIFALGLILNEMFTKQIPQGTGHRVIASEAPDFAYLDPLIEKMIRQDPADRPSSIAEVKDELMMRGADFVTHQRLDAIQKIVVPAVSPDDPLGGTDVKAIEFDYTPGFLTFRFEPDAPPGWLNALHGLRNFEFFAGLAEPARVQITSDGAAKVPASENTAVEVKRMVQNWVRSTNHEYRMQLREKAEGEERRRYQALAVQRQSLEERARVRKRLLQDLPS